MRTTLLDANVLIALTVTEHEHHQRARTWFADIERFALCPLTEGALVRFLVRLGESPASVSTVLDGFHAHSRCQWWADDLSYADVDLTGARGHRQVTDAYLAGLAAHHVALLATFDSALGELRPDSTLLIP